MDRPGLSARKADTAIRNQEMELLTAPALCKGGRDEAHLFDQICLMLGLYGDYGDFSIRHMLLLRP